MSDSSQGGGIGASIFLLAFAIAGLTLSIQGQYRGDQKFFVAAFAVIIGISVLEIVLGCFICICFFRIIKSEKGILSTSLATLICLVVSTVGSIAGFTLLIVALVTAEAIPNSDAAGCANGFGCANIMAIICTISYGGRILALVKGLLNTIINCPNSNEEEDEEVSLDSSL